MSRICAWVMRGKRDADAGWLDIFCLRREGGCCCSCQPAFVALALSYPTFNNLFLVLTTIHLAHSSRSINIDQPAEKKSRVFRERVLASD